MIKIIKANKKDAEVIALLGTITYTESHGQFINDKNDLMKYIADAFAVSKMKLEINSPNNLFYIMYKDNLPIGYAKLVLNTFYENINTQNTCQLERIYILKDFIPLKLGQHFLSFLENKTKELGLDTLWLSVYKMNTRAIRFYKRNYFNIVGTTTFLVNDTAYQNIVFSKKLHVCEN